MNSRNFLLLAALLCLFKHALRSLSYFEDAEEDADPILFEEAPWSAVKKFIEKEVSLI
jgi:hypothetical protein